MTLRQNTSRGSTSSNPNGLLTLFLQEISIGKFAEWFFRYGFLKPLESKCVKSASALSPLVLQAVLFGLQSQKSGQKIEEIDCALTPGSPYLLPIDTYFNTIITS